MITINGKHQLSATPAVIWSRIFDPASLAALIPGCQQLEQVSTDEYRGVVRVGIAAVGGTYHTRVQISERRAPEYCAFDGAVDGPTGTVTGSVTFTLQAANDGTTELLYVGKAMISGALSTLSSRLIESVAQTLLKQGLDRFNQQLQLSPQEDAHAHH